MEREIRGKVMQKNQDTAHKVVPIQQFGGSTPQFVGHLHRLIILSSLSFLPYALCRPAHARHESKRINITFSSQYKQANVKLHRSLYTRDM